MSLAGYGVLKSTPIETMFASNATNVNTANSMAHLEIHTRAKKRDFRIALNVCSTETPSELRYIIIKDFKNPITKEFEKLEDGFTPLDSKANTAAIDFLRQGLFDIKFMKTAHQIEGTENELADTLNFYFEKAIDSDSARIYAFGQHWVPKQDNPNEADKYFNFVPAEGIHDIHMNQGNPGSRFQKDNGIYQDGALFIHFPSTDESDGRWVAVFLAFQSQALHTDDKTGNPEEFEDDSIEDNVVLVSGLFGASASSRANRTFTVLNTSDTDINLDNWYIFISKKNKFTISGVTIKAGETAVISIPEQINFSYSGGMISLYDNKATLVCSVTYTAEDYYRKNKKILFKNERLFYPMIAEEEVAAAMVQVTEKVENNGSTQRTKKLLDSLLVKGFSDRSSEWFENSMFEPVANEELSTIERRAISFKHMLKAMTNPENSKTTHSYEIEQDELLVGNMPMGSVGFGKSFPQYLTEEEQRLLTLSCRDMQSTFGHNIPNHTVVLKEGLKSLVEKAEAGIANSDQQEDEFRKRRQEQFYKAVIICCNAVREYASDFAKLANTQAEAEENDERKKELLEIARICNKVPWEPAETFREAIQSLYFVHMILHSTLDYVSLGRLDQVLNPYLVRDLEQKIITEAEALELYECLILKCGGRINLNPKYFLKQDHCSFGGVFGDSPVFLDQIASANNFLQNITLGGYDKDGKEASNISTKLILEASANMGLPTPIVNMRITPDTPEDVKLAAVESQRKGRNGMPVIFNDDSIVKGLINNGISVESSRDYGIDGCWEPILNAECDWVFGMVNFLTILELSLNSGCTFTTNPSLLRGVKVSYVTKLPDKIESFEELLEIMKVHTQFYMDKTLLTAYNYYSVEGSAAPTPFFSALLGGCMERGMDKTWGGADYHLLGVLAIALPNCVNALANIKKFVFEEKKYSLQEVCDALKVNFKGYEEMKNLFWNDKNKFGNNSPYADSIMKNILEMFRTSALKAKKLADETFLEHPGDKQARIMSHRSICGYDGNSLQEAFGDRFKLTLNLGCGTFGQYTLTGAGMNASADGRAKGDAIAANFSPTSGTMKNGLGNALASLKDLNLEEFPAGAVVDFCIDDTTEHRDNEYYINFIDEFTRNNGSIMSVTFAKADDLKKIYALCEEVRAGKKDADVLRPYSHVMVRVGGFNAPYITLPEGQQKNYLERITSK